MVVAGYEHEIIEFLASNSGLASRFQETLIFEAWTPEQCLVSLRSKFQKDEDLNIPEYLNHLLLEYFAQLSSLDGFASARDVYEVIYKKMSTEWQAAFDFNPSGSLCDPPPMSEEIIRHAVDAVIAPPCLVFKSCVLHHCSTLLLAGVLRGKGVGVDRGRGGRGRGGMRDR